MGCHLRTKVLPSRNSLGEINGDVFEADFRPVERFTFR
jgi:hypothetical protein